MRRVIIQTRGVATAVCVYTQPNPRHQRVTLAVTATTAAAADDYFVATTATAAGCCCCCYYYTDHRTSAWRRPVALGLHHGDYVIVVIRDCYDHSLTHTHTANNRESVGALEMANYK